MSPQEVEHPVEHRTGTAWTRARGVGVGWDGSSSSWTAVRWAAAEAAARRSPLTVVHGAGSYATWLDPVVYPDLREVLHQVGARGEELAAEELAGSKDPGATAVEVGRLTGVLTGQEILIMSSADADLVVVGNRGRGELTAALRGSVSFAVAARAHCPVVVVLGDEVRRAGPGSPVVVGYDGSPPARSAAAFAAGAAARAGAELVVVQVQDDHAPLVYDVAPVPEVVLDGRAAQALQRQGRLLLDELRQDHPGLRASLRLRRGDPARVLLEDSRRAGLVVVGSRGRGRITRLLLGSTSTDLVHRAEVPVAVVPAHREA